MVIASIDLMDGKAVQLKQGREKILERENPLQLAREFGRYGEIAVIDLNAALGEGDNRRFIKEICQIAECRVGGGIRSIEQAKEMISYGASKVIIGTKVWEDDAVNQSFLKTLASAVGINHIILAIDSFHGEIVTRGWQHKTGLDLFDVIADIEQYASEFLFTCVEKEGRMQGADMVTIKKLRNMTQIKLTVAGGVSSMEEIVRLAEIGVDVQLGMALYTGKIQIGAAFIESLNWKKKLLPTITRDTAGQVLMLAYSSRTSLKKTFETGQMWYFSRSRNRLWMKGETSENVQRFIRIKADCDRDALLATVRQRGEACHLGNYSCFGDKKFSLNELYDVIRDRLDNPMSGSYTATLTDKRMREKINEEAQEIGDAKGRDEIVWEAADLLYFLTVLLAKNNIELEDVLNELRRRRRK